VVIWLEIKVEVCEIIAVEAPPISLSADLDHPQARGVAVLHDNLVINFQLYLNV
jgi:hypothetical protein